MKRLSALFRGIKNGRPYGKEQEIVNQIIEYLIRMRIPYVHVRNTGSIISGRRAGDLKFGRPKYEQKGVADIIAAYRGTAVAIEVKRPDGTLTEAQTDWLKMWRDRGGGHYIVASDVEDVLTLFRALDGMRAGRGAGNG